MVEMWIFMGLAWLSLFFSWNVHMVVEAHKVFKKRRYQRRHRFSLEELRQHDETLVSVHSRSGAEPKPSVIDIFNYLTVKEEDYGDIIKQIGSEPKKEKKKKKVRIQEDVPRSKSCSDILNDMGIMTLEQSPRLKRRLSISDNVFSVVSKAKASDMENEENQVLLEDLDGEEQSPEGTPGEGSSPQQEDNAVKRWCSWETTEPDPAASVHQSQNGDDTVEQEVKTSKEEVGDGGGSRFTVLKVSETALKEENETEG